MALLNAYGRSHAGIDRNAFDAIARLDLPRMRSLPDAIERHRLHQQGKLHLPRLDLLKRNLGNVWRGELPGSDARPGHVKHSVEV